MNETKITRPQHTPEPWVMYANSPDADGSECLPSIMAKNPLGNSLFYVAQANMSADAARIVACVNACANLDPSAIPALVEAAEHAEEVLGEYADADYSDNLERAVGNMAHSARSDLRAALAAVRGQK